MQTEFAHAQAQRYLAQRNRFAALSAVLAATSVLAIGAAIKGLCGKYLMPVMRKQQYRFQTTNPNPATSGRYACPRNLRRRRRPRRFARSAPPRPPRRRPAMKRICAAALSREEVLLHERDAQGLCAYVGTYCSDKFLGVCLTKKKVYCCFESKLSRILQEQGRRQLPKPWAKPKEETCQGFTLGEFARLDLSRMDFSEVYAEFTEAARLPDELETSVLIQQKIEDYYAREAR